jgi:hypothetical protein
LVLLHLLVTTVVTTPFFSGDKILILHRFIKDTQFLVYGGPIQAVKTNPLSCGFGPHLFLPSALIMLQPSTIMPCSDNGFCFPAALGNNFFQLLRIERY